MDPCTNTSTVTRKQAGQQAALIQRMESKAWGHMNCMNVDRGKAVVIMGMVDGLAF